MKIKKRRFELQSTYWQKFQHNESLKILLYNSISFYGLKTKDFFTVVHFIHCK